MQGKGVLNYLDFRLNLESEHFFFVNCVKRYQWKDTSNENNLAKNTSQLLAKTTVGLDLV